MHRVFLINVDTICCHAKWWRLSTVKNRGRGKRVPSKLKFTAALKTLYTCIVIDEAYRIRR